MYQLSMPFSVAAKGHDAGINNRKLKRTKKRSIPWLGEKDRQRLFLFQDEVPP